MLLLDQHKSPSETGRAQSTIPWAQTLEIGSTVGYADSANNTQYGGYFGGSHPLLEECP
jgi:hypothetical protein